MVFLGVGDSFLKHPHSPWWVLGEGPGVTQERVGQPVRGVLFSNRLDRFIRQGTGLLGPSERGQLVEQAGQADAPGEPGSLS